MRHRSPFFAALLVLSLLVPVSLAPIRFVTAAPPAQTEPWEPQVAIV